MRVSAPRAARRILRCVSVVPLGVRPLSRHVLPIMERDAGSEQRGRLGAALARRRGGREPGALLDRTVYVFARHGAAVYIRSERAAALVVRPLSRQVLAGLHETSRQAENRCRSLTL